MGRDGPPEFRRDPPVPILPHPGAPYCPILSPGVSVSTGRQSIVIRLIYAEPTSTDRTNPHSVTNACSNLHRTGGHRADTNRTAPNRQTFFVRMLSARLKSSGTTDAINDVYLPE